MRALRQTQPDQRDLHVAGEADVVGLAAPPPVEYAWQRTGSLQPLQQTFGRGLDRRHALIDLKTFGRAEHPGKRVGNGMRVRSPRCVIGAREATSVDPAGLRIAELEDPAQIALGAGHQSGNFEIAADLGDPAGGVRAVRAGDALIKVLTPCAVLVLHVTDPPGGARERVEHAAILRLPEPSVQSVRDLRRVERRRPRSIVRDLERRKGAGGQLDREQEVDAPLGARQPRVVGEHVRDGEKRWDQIAGGFGIRRRPASDQSEAAGDAAILRRVLRPPEPFGRGAQRALVGTDGVPRASRCEPVGCH